MKKIRKVAIVGAPGSGKTTLSYKLQEIFKLPICHIDSIHQLPNWVLRETSERDRMILEETKKDEWIMDGTFTDTLEERVKVADIIIFLDYPTIVSLMGVFKRLATRLGKEKPDMPGCKEKFDLSFIIYVAGYNKERRKYIVEILEKYKDRNIKVFKKRKELKKWLKELEEFTNND